MKALLIIPILTIFLCGCANSLKISDIKNLAFCYNKKGEILLSIVDAQKKKKYKLELFKEDSLNFVLIDSEKVYLNLDVSFSDSSDSLIWDQYYPCIKNEYYAFNWFYAVDVLYVINSKGKIESCIVLNDFIEQKLKQKIKECALNLSPNSFSQNAIGKNSWCIIRKRYSPERLIYYIER
ncbi:MAG: hypothetical protein R2799_05620 [Crocinitomicaceae bacterium]